MKIAEKILFPNVDITRSSSVLRTDGAFLNQRIESKKK